MQNDVEVNAISDNRPRLYTHYTATHIISTLNIDVGMATWHRFSETSYTGWGHKNGSPLNDDFWRSEHLMIRFV